jgi:hypothetical protein
MKKIIIITLCSCLVTFMISCSQKEESTYIQHPDLNPIGYHEQSRIEYPENIRAIRHEVKEEVSYSSTDVK